MINLILIGFLYYLQMPLFISNTKLFDNNANIALVEQDSIFFKKIYQDKSFASNYYFNKFEIDTILGQTRDTIRGVHKQTGHLIEFDLVRLKQAREVHYNLEYSLLDDIILRIDNHNLNLSKILIQSNIPLISIMTDLGNSSTDSKVRHIKLKNEEYILIHGDIYYANGTYWDLNVLLIIHIKDKKYKLYPIEYQYAYPFDFENLFFGDFDNDGNPDFINPKVENFATSDVVDGITNDKAWKRVTLIPYSIKNGKIVQLKDKSKRIYAIEYEYERWKADKLKINYYYWFK